MEPVGIRAKIGLIALIMVVMLTGCWSRRELETLGFITAVGLDHAREEGKIQLTVQMAKPFAITGSVNRSGKALHDATVHSVRSCQNLNSISFGLSGPARLLSSGGHGRDEFKKH